MAPFRLCFASVLCALGFSSKLAFSACPNDFSIEMWVALPIKDESENLRKLDDLFWKVSDIASEQYGQYLSAEELQSYMKTEPQVIQRVASHFEKHGVSCGDWYRFGDALKCEGRCNAIQEALGVGASLYLPLGHHGEVVTATIHNWNARHAALQDVLFIDFQMFGSGQIWSTVSEVLMKVDNPVTVPETIFNVYNIPDRLQGDPSIVQAPVEFFQGNITLTGSAISLASFTVQLLSGHASHPCDPFLICSIVNESVSDWIVQAASDPFDVYYRVNLTGVPPRGALEASLDVEYLGGVGRGMTNQYIITTHWFYGFAKELLSECDIPDVLSISFGTEENHACAFKSGSAECAEHGWNNTQYMYYTNLQYQALALRGVTVAVSSGDHGAEVIGGAGMKNVSNPTYLTSSPYVTSVGGTQFVNPVNTGLKAPACHTGEFMCLSSGDEIVASVETGSQITTGGGFSFASARSLAPYQVYCVALVCSLCCGSWSSTCCLRNAWWKSTCETPTLICLHLTFSTGTDEGIQTSLQLQTLFWLK